MRFVLGLAAVVLLSGCGTYARTVDSISGVAKAGAATVDILKGPGEDVLAVWSTVFPANAPIEAAK